MTVADETGAAMRKNRWLLLGLLLASIVGVVLLVLALLPPSPGVTKVNFDRIEVGMTRAEVEVILGGSWSLVLHFDQDVFLTDSVTHLHLLARVILMTMFDGVDDGLFQHQVDAENVLLRIAQFGHEIDHDLDDRRHLLG
jgi:hypothetical protein